MSFKREFLIKALANSVRSCVNGNWRGIDWGIEWGINWMRIEWGIELNENWIEKKLNWRIGNWKLEKELNWMRIEWGWIEYGLKPILKKISSRMFQSLTTNCCFSLKQFIDWFNILIDRYLSAYLESCHILLASFYDYRRRSVWEGCGNPTYKMYQNKDICRKYFILICIIYSVGLFLLHYWQHRFFLLHYLQRSIILLHYIKRTNVFAALFKVWDYNNNFQKRVFAVLNLWNALFKVANNKTINYLPARWFKWPLLSTVAQVFVTLGINLQLLFESNSWSSRAEDRLVSTEFVDFNKEPGKVRFYLYFFHYYCIHFLCKTN